ALRAPARRDPRGRARPRRRGIALVSDLRYRRRPDVLWRGSLDAVIVLAAGEAAEPITVAGTGPAVWELLADRCTLADLAGRLGARCAVTPETVERDVAPLLEQLVAAGAVEAVRGEG